MRLKLDDKFMLCSDHNCVWITKVVMRKKGRNVGDKGTSGAYDGYHRNITDCFESFFDMQVQLAQTKRRGENREEDLDDAESIKAIEADVKIQDLLREIKNAKKEIKNWCKTIDKDIRVIRSDEERSL